MLVRSFLFWLALLTPIAQSGLAATYNYPADALPASVAAGDTLNVGAQAPFGSSVTGDPGSQVKLLTGGGLFSLTLRGSGELAAGAAGVSSLSVDGGELHASGGVLGQRSEFQNGAHALVDGSNFLAGVRLVNSAIDFHTGNLGGAELRADSTLNIYGPGVVSEIQVFSGQLNLHGGGLALHPSAPPTAVILSVYDRLSVFVQSATLDGNPIAGLSLGTPVTILARDVNLETVLADGTPFTVPLTNDAGPGNFDFYRSSMVTVTLVPEPASIALVAVAMTGLGAGRSRATTARQAE